MVRCALAIRRRLEVLQGKLDGRVGLQRHAGVDTVDVQAGNHGLFLVVVCSSSTMEARVHTSSCVMPMAFALLSRSRFQNF